MNELLIFGAKYLVFVMILIAAALFFYLPSVNKKKAAIFSILVLPISFIVAKIFSFFFYNPRPFVVEKITPLIAHVADNGFPSDHTLLASALAAIVFYFNKKAGVLFWILTVIVGASRVLAKVHHPLDIFGSIVIVIVVACLSEIFFLPFIEKKISKK